MSVKLRGCEEELHQITAALELPRRAALAIIITGAEGTGKTNLLRETASAATNLGYEVAALVQGSDWSRPVGLAGRDQGHQDLFDALAAVPQGTPIMVAVDDADRADPGRLARMRESARRIYGANVVWALAASPGMRGVPTGWFRHQDQEYVTSIQLAGLAEGAVREMVADLLGAPPCNQLAAFAAQTGGNPRLVNELVTGLRDEGQLRVTGDEAQLLSDRIPLRLDILVRNRLSRLSVRCRQMLQVTAVLGRTVCPSRVAVLPGETKASILPILDEATASGILTRRGDELAFRSDLVRRVIRQTIPAPVRSALEIEVALSPTRVQPRVPTQRAARTPWDDLTETERTIAHLVSDGLTNRQIAKRIYLSPHTVNYHLRRIFKKLDIASRVELATLANKNRRPS